MSTQAEIDAGAAALDDAGPWPRPDETVLDFTERASEAMLAAVEPLIRERLAQEIEEAKRKPIDAAVRRAVADHPTTPYVVDQTLKAAARIVRGDAS